MNNYSGWKVLAALDVPLSVIAKIEQRHPQIIVERSRHIPAGKVLAINAEAIEAATKEAVTTIAWEWRG